MQLLNVHDSMCKPEYCEHFETDTVLKPMFKHLTERASPHFVIVAVQRKLHVEGGMFLKVNVSF